MNQNQLGAEESKHPSVRSYFRFDSNDKQKSILFGIVTFSLLFILGVLIYFFANFIINIDKTANIEVLVAPSNATIKLITAEKTETIPTETKRKIKPGTYTVEISLDGFETYKNQFTIEKDQTFYLYEFLSQTEESAVTSDYYATNKNEASRAQMISDLKAKIEQDTYVSQDPIFSVTPFSSYEKGYDIFTSKTPFTGATSDPSESNLTTDFNTKTYVKIYLYTCKESELNKLKESALDYLKSNNINPENYIITYSNC